MSPASKMVNRTFHKHFIAVIARPVSEKVKGLTGGSNLPFTQSQSIKCI